MNARARHLDAICAALERKLDAAPPAAARRLLRPQFRWVAQQLDDGGGEELAHRLGVVELVESCRNEHLASLDADDGLAVLQIEWTEIVVHVSELMRTAGAADILAGADQVARGLLVRLGHAHRDQLAEA